ncbi:hypothetical protein [Arsenicicoccus dermatophilus]|uniref:hypothetical protein n=1 Tax=Arsenicicoccus dermatophilus TaxID=1076331 RepID=UPI001F4C573D|nr:hypothetical protein [Arsenicicoccus dermatophilus]MCH8614195.1 hypothetical protein [Arsenicicoccus dermatophilus]
MRGAEPQRWTLRHDGHDHVLEVRPGVRTSVRLSVDGAEVASATTSDERVDLTPKDAAHWVRVEVRLTRLGRVRRATLVVPGRSVDLDPEPGSPAALRLERRRQAPWRYAALDVLVAAGRVVLPLLGLGAIAKAIVEPLLRWFEEHLPRPDLPSVPWPQIHLPQIPWPDLPEIPLPDVDLPSWTPPGWLGWLLDQLHFLWPVILAAILSVAEIRRRRKQDALKAELAEVERRELLTRLAGDLAAVARGGGEVRTGAEGELSGIRSRGDRPDPRAGAVAGAAGRHRPR